MVVRYSHHGSSAAALNTEPVEQKNNYRCMHIVLWSTMRCIMCAHNVMVDEGVQSCKCEYKQLSHVPKPLLTCVRISWRWWRDRGHNTKSPGVFLVIGIPTPLKSWLNNSPLQLQDVVIRLLSLRGMQTASPGICIDCASETKKKKPTIICLMKS